MFKVQGSNACKVQCFAFKCFAFKRSIVTSKILQTVNPFNYFQGSLPTYSGNAFSKAILTFTITRILSLNQTNPFAQLHESFCSTTRILLLNYPNPFFLKSRGLFFKKHISFLKTISQLSFCILRDLF